MALSMVESSAFEDGQDIIGTKIRAEILNILNNPENLFDPLVLNSGSAPSVVGQIGRTGTGAPQYFDTAARTFLFRHNQYVASTVTEVSVHSTATLSNLWTLAIPAGTLGTSGVLMGEINLIVNTILNGSSLALRLIYGSTLLFNPVLQNVSGGQEATFGIRLTFSLASRNVSATAQSFSGTVGVGRETANLNWGSGPSTLWTLHRTAVAAENSAIAQNLQLDCQWSVADANNSVNGENMVVYRAAL